MEFNIMSEASILVKDVVKALLKNLAPAASINQMDRVFDVEAIEIETR